MKMSWEDVRNILDFRQDLIDEGDQEILYKMDKLGVFQQLHDMWGLNMLASAYSWRISVEDADNVIQKYNNCPDSMKSEVLWANILTLQKKSMIDTINT